MGRVVKKVFILKTRNYQAINAWKRTGAGKHKDHKLAAKTDGCDLKYWADELEDLATESDDLDDEQ